MLRAVFNSVTIEDRLAAPGDKWHKDPEDVIPLWLADTDFPLCPELKQSLHDAIDAGITVYGKDIDARKAMSAKIKKVNNIEIPPEQILLTQGVSPIMWLAIRHACKPGDEVILTNPMYHPFLKSVTVTQTEPVYWNLEFEEGYRFDLERLKQCISPKSKLLFVCNPHNPTGRAMTKEELKGIADIAVDHKIYVMVDELHEDIIFDGRKHISLASLGPEISDLTVSGWGYSKTWSIPGLQSGYLGCTNPNMFKSLVKIANGVMRGTNTFSQWVAPLLSSGELDYWVKAMNKHLETIRDLVSKRLVEMGDISVPNLEATYLMFPKWNYGLSSTELDKIIGDEGKVRLALGTKFGSKGEGHMRILTATSEGIMNEALDRIEKVMPKIEKMKK
jgi:bifunctional pyridoxal-dependent enzyme with beta-cystathionase and maltose regulon repressor activities